MTKHTLLLAPIGGVLVGGGLTLFMALTGRSTGISGMALFSGTREERADSGAFLAGVIATGIALVALLPQLAIDVTGRPWIAFAVGGALVGWGSRRANGCTSGHGILGVARGNTRSFVAVVLFVVSATLVTALWPAGGGS